MTKLEYRHKINSLGNDIIEQTIKYHEAKMKLLKLQLERNKLVIKMRKSLTDDN